MIHSYAPSSAPAVSFGPLDGVLLVDKPAGITSHDVVYKIRKKFNIEKVGHGGTLDPEATGLLVILLGKGTRLSEKIMGGNKVYSGILRLGIQTNSQDSDGEITATADPSGVTRESLEAVLRTFVGDQYQTPPMVSAIKINGVPLYKMARKGKEVERKDRFVHVFSFELKSFGIPDCEIIVHCTKGTYIRTLCNDAGEKLGCHGHLVGLRRLRSGSYDVANALKLDQILEMDSKTLEEHVIPMIEASGL